jgi:hypothetical protein
MKKLIIFVMLVVAMSINAQIHIENRTNIECAQVMSEIIAHDIMSFDTISVMIFPLPKSSTIDGAVVKNKCEPHTYTLLLNESLSVKRLMHTLAHEFVHIHQYEYEGLEIFGDIWVWNPDGLKEKQDVTWGSMTFTGYDTRKFEVDAHDRQWIVSKKLNKIMKTK